MAPQYYEHDEYYSSDPYGVGARHVRPTHRRMESSPFRRSDFLAPEAGAFSASGLNRSRSTGHRPPPNIHIYNTVEQDMHPRLDQTQRTPAASPRGRPVVLDDEWALGDESAFRLGRSHSRGRGFNDHFHHHDHFGTSPSPDYRTQMQLAARDAERVRALEERQLLEREEELVRLKMEQKYMREKQEREEEEALFGKRLKLKLLKDKQEREEEEDRLKREEERIREKYERKRLDDERKREDERKEMDEMRKKAVRDERERAESEAAAKKAAAEEYQRKKEAAEREAAAENKRLIEDYQRKKEREAKEAAEEKKRLIDEYERRKVEDAKKQREEEEKLIAKLKKQEEEKKAREKAEWEEFERKRKEKEEKAAEEKKRKEMELEDDMRKRLARFGFQENQIQAMIKPEKAKELPQGLSPANPITGQISTPHHHHHHHHQAAPTYVKVHRDHLSIETLTFYGLPWEWDRTDTEYIIILREMDARETDILFEHTRRLRSRTTTHLLVEERRDRGKPEYAWVRRRAHSKSPARRRSSPRRVIGIGDMFR